MKKLMTVVLCWLGMAMAIAQERSESIKDDRIRRDVEVAENVLSTLIRQQMERRTNFWVGDVKGTYTPGFGVTLRIPYENWVWAQGSNITTTGTYSQGGVTVIDRSRLRDEREKAEVEALASTSHKAKRRVDRDSAQIAYGERLVAASKAFLADYGDLLGLEPNEKILITTKNDRQWNNLVFVTGQGSDYKRTVITVEGQKSDLTAYKQGKITRDQLMGKLKVLNTEVTDENQPDLELMSTILNRLYRSDLSKTYYMEGTPDYEHLKNFGVTYYMSVYSSTDAGYKRWNMPTQGLEDISQEDRDGKVKSLYPLFEKDLKETMVDYGRTLTSIKDEEMLILDIKLTKCTGCGIPSTLELSVKASALKEYSTGKISKEVALSKVNVKKGTPQ